MICFPGEWVSQQSSAQPLLCLSERQREVLKLLAAGSQIKRLPAINISAATVKAHLEALFGGWR
jgi:DNA-binding NarL/FixJ family response regulator